MGIKDKLIEKLEKEYKDFVEDLKKKTPEEIIDKSYELVVKNETIAEIKDMGLEKNEIKALLKEDNLLTEIYDDWINSDGRLGELIYDTMADTIDIIIENFERIEKQKNKESR